MGRSIASGGGAGASGKPPCFSAGIFIPCWFFRRLRPEGNAGKQQAERTAVRAAPIVCPKESPCVFSPTTARRGCRGASGKPPASSNRQQLCRKQSPMVGNDAPTLACGHGLQPYGTLDCFEWRSEGGAGGERREARAQWAQPPKAVSAPEFRQTTSGAHGSAGRADCLPRGKPPSAPAGAYPTPLIRRLPEGVQGGT